VRGLGQATGFTAEVLNSGGMDQEAFSKLRDEILAEARDLPQLSNVRLTGLPDQPTLKITTDTAKLAALGLRRRM
jgi:multidrug efflux pump